MRMIFGSVIAIILLGLYVYCVAVGIFVVTCAAETGCTGWPMAKFTEGFVSTMTLTGGLVSALVIAELAITPPGSAPVARALDTDSSKLAKSGVAIVTACYLIVWAATGLSAFVVGYLQHPKTLQPLTDLGQGWLGLAIAAGYAYFGIKPSSTPP